MEDLYVSSRLVQVKELTRRNIRCARSAGWWPPGAALGGGGSGPAGVERAGHPLPACWLQCYLLNCRALAPPLHRHTPPALTPNKLRCRELLRDFSYNGIRALITLAVAICLGTLYANQGQEVGTYAGALPLAGGSTGWAGEGLRSRGRGSPHPGLWVESFVDVGEVLALLLVGRFLALHLTPTLTPPATARFCLRRRAQRGGRHVLGNHVCECGQYTKPAGCTPRPLGSMGPARAG